jgi:hypothetical protein
MPTISDILARLRKFPRLWRVLVKVGTRAGVSPQNLVLVETVSRPWWFYRSRGRLKLGKIRRKPPAPVTDADVFLCERLISAFKAASNDQREPEASGAWAHLIDMNYQELANALESGEAHDLANLLASMFQQKITSGFMMQADVSATFSWLGSQILGIKSLDTLVSLAEAIGAVPVDGPEIRMAGLVFDENIATLLTRVDQKLGFKVAFPDIGAPFGLTVDERLITLETPDQIYAAVRLDHAVTTHLALRALEQQSVVEIGGGYGALCHWFLRLHPDVSRYTIVDFPIVNVLQGYFLSRAGLSVSFYGEQLAQVAILPTGALADIETPFGVLVNKDSMTEMPNETMTSYIEWGRRYCNGLFYSYNVEAGIDFLGCTSGCVAAAVDRVGGFRRTRRDPSWLRRGYIEEIYIPDPYTARAVSAGA